MHTEDTIAAISTPVGPGGIGIIRLSGKDSLEIADRLFSPQGKDTVKKSLSHRILYGHIIDPSTQEIIDEVLVSIMLAPQTYTREDIIEINCHGGAVPMRRVLELVIRNGARQAGPGEFTQRAFLNGRIDLTRAEAVLDVINAMTVQSQKSAVEQLRGGLSGKIEAIREQLIDLSAFVEAHIDFPEEDIGALSVKEMKLRASEISGSLRKLIEGSQYGLILREGLNTAIIGKPNVGKSSLLNALLEHDRAIVTEIPGTTRDVIEDYLNIKGLPVKIMDTAGIRNVEDIAEQEGVKRSLRAMDDADLVLLVLDGSREIGNTDRELLGKSVPEKTIYVLNKIDLAGDDFRPVSTPLPAVEVSAKKGTGLEALKEKIMVTALNGQAECGTNIVTNTRHVHAIEKSLASMSAFIEELSKETSPEFLSVELRDALDAIGEILGITTPEEILNRIFGSFCIGK